MSQTLLTLRLPAFSGQIGEPRAAERCLQPGTSGVQDSIDLIMGPCSLMLISSTVHEVDLFAGLLADPAGIEALRMHTAGSHFAHAMHIRMVDVSRISSMHVSSLGLFQTVLPLCMSDLLGWPYQVVLPDTARRG